MHKAEIITLIRCRHGEVQGTKRSFTSWDAAHGFIAAQCGGVLPQPRPVASSGLGEAAFKSSTVTRVYAYGDVEFTAEGPHENAC